MNFIGTAVNYRHWKSKHASVYLMCYFWSLICAHTDTTLKHSIAAAVKCKFYIFVVVGVVSSILLLLLLFILHEIGTTGIKLKNYTMYK